MRPVQVNIQVGQQCEQVYEFLDVMANHEPFTDHIMRNWRYSGPERGVGSKATVDVSAGGRTDTVEIEVIAAERPTRIVEQNTGANGRRVGHGTYILEATPDAGTLITFEYSWERAPISERLAAPLVRAILRRANQRAMQRLADRLAELKPVSKGDQDSLAA